ncbi:MAG: Ku protein [Cellvibrio sp.]|uniref:non-homologous end joining protein Ku n=1 Tax=Cellvibrio sp. TaxID=1965322 RepID=UPI0031A3B8B9
MARSIWKGAISFGLVHIPVALQSATASETIDFDWLDKRTMERVGYKRVNKVSGKEVKKENIVKGIQHEKGKYILLSDEEIKSAHPKSTQTIEIFSFLNSADIPLTNIDTPYYLAPDKRGEKVYTLLRETLSDTGTVGLASVILHTKQHLAAVMPIDSALVLILLRWPSEVRSLDTLELTTATTKVTLSKAEKDMAKRLVADMKGNWSPEEYRDTFQEKIMALVDKKAAEGKIEDVETEAGEEPRKTADIIDLTELLKRSLGGSKATKPRAKPSTVVKKTATSKPAATTARPKKATASTTSKSAAPKKAAAAKPKRAPKKASSK